MTRSEPNPRAVDELVDLLREVRDHHRATGEPVARDNAISKAADAARRLGRDSTATLLDKIAAKDADDRDAWRRATRAPSARCEADGHRYQVVGRHKPTEIRCAEPGCGAGPWMVGTR